MSRVSLAACLYFSSFVVGLNVIKIKSILIWEQLALSALTGAVYFLLFAETILLSGVVRPTRMQFASLLFVGFLCGVITSMAYYLWVLKSGMSHHVAMLAIIGVFLGPAASRLLANRFPGSSDKQ